MNDEKIQGTSHKLPGQTLDVVVSSDKRSGQDPDRAGGKAFHKRAV